RIHDGMVNLLKTKAYNDITVKDICEKSQISRTTFYTHYKTKDDFIYSYLNTLLKEAKKKFLKSETLTQATFLKKMIY
ncbi:TetR/AcrR family transcriptional regulator, partial [Staphylococcus aureus]